MPETINRSYPFKIESALINASLAFVIMVLSSIGLIFPIHAQVSEVNLGILTDISDQQLVEKEDIENYTRKIRFQISKGRINFYDSLDTRGPTVLVRENPVGDEGHIKTYRNGFRIFRENINNKIIDYFFIGPNNSVIKVSSRKRGAPSIKVFYDESIRNYPADSQYDNYEAADLFNEINADPEKWFESRTSRAASVPKSNGLQSDNQQGGKKSSVKLYAFTSDDPAMSGGIASPPVGTSIILFRANSASQARQMIASDPWTSGHRLMRQIDNEKCGSGKFLLGVNNFAGSRPFGIAAIFLHCNFVSEDEAIRKGALDSGKPFFQWLIGNVDGPVGPVDVEGACSWNRPNAPGWSQHTANVGFTNNPSRDGGRFCNKLDASVPVLVDREPQEVILITP